MKRLPNTPEPEWKILQNQRKDQAAYNMFIADLKKGFVTMSQIRFLRSLLKISEEAAQQILTTNPESLTKEQLDQIMRVSS